MHRKGCPSKLNILISYTNQARILQYDFQIQFCSQPSYGRNLHFRLDVVEIPAARVTTLSTTSSSSSVSIGVYQLLRTP